MRSSAFRGTYINILHTFQAILKYTFQDILKYTIHSIKLSILKYISRYIEIHIKLYWNIEMCHNTFQSVLKYLRRRVGSLFKSPWVNFSLSYSQVLAPALQLLTLLLFPPEIRLDKRCHLTRTISPTGLSPTSLMQSPEPLWSRRFTRGSTDPSSTATEANV